MVKTAERFTKQIQNVNGQWRMVNVNKQ